MLKEQAEHFSTIKNLKGDWNVTKIRPGTGITINFPCPKSLEKDGCEEGEREWKCFKCDEAVKYGFDQKLYCKCGNQKVYEFGFKCLSDVHGDDYVQFKQDKLDDLMSRLQLPNTGWVVRWLELVSNSFPIKKKFKINIDTLEIYVISSMEAKCIQNLKNSGSLCPRLLDMQSWQMFI